MTGFSAEWLALRAPADDAARDAGLVRKLTGWAGTRRLRIADIGGGSGAAHRALAPLLPNAQWRILDDDPDLLALIPKDAVAVETDLAASQDAIFSPAPDLVTAFAFVDLVSESWLSAMVERLAAASAALYAPLTYDGLEVWRPEPPHEAEALAAFNADMRRDKGFGPALGAAAASRLAALLAERGFEVATALSPWRLTPGPLLSALAEGSAGAVLGRMPSDEIVAWSEGRRRASSAEIGHLDILALPPS